MGIEKGQETSDLEKMKDLSTKANAVMQDVFTSLYSDLCKCRQENKDLQRQCEQFKESNESYDKIVSLLEDIKNNITIAQDAQERIEDTQNDQKTEFETFKQTQKELKDKFASLDFASLNRAVTSLEEERKNVKEERKNVEKAQDDADKLRGRLEEKEEELKRWEKILKGREKELGNSQNPAGAQEQLEELQQDKTRLEAEVEKKVEKIKTLQKTIQDKNVEIEKKDGEITKLKKIEDDLTAELERIKGKVSSPCEQNEAKDVHNGN